jgi:hypothetical protein
MKTEARLRRYATKLDEELKLLKVRLVLGAFAKLRKASISFVISVRLSVRMEQLCFHWTKFYDI